MEIIKSISYSNEEILLNILKLIGKNRFDLDCTYSKGIFYKNTSIPEPLVKSDINPLFSDVIKASSTNLPFKDNSFETIVFDPPFLIGGKITKQEKNSSIIGKRFGYFLSFEELKSMYYQSLKEFYRLLKPDGYVIFKCQDTISSNTNYFTHNEVLYLAINIGFYPKDLFILLAKNRVNSYNGKKWKRQLHARKYHSYFWLFQKTNKKVNYTIY